MRLLRRQSFKDVECVKVTDAIIVRVQEMNRTKLTNSISWTLTKRKRLRLTSSPRLLRLFGWAVKIFV